MILLRHIPSPPNFRRGSVRRALAPHWGAVLALALFLTAGLAVLDDYGIIGDEVFLRQGIQANLRYLAGDSGLRDFTSALFVEHDKFYGMAFEFPLLLSERVLGMEDGRATYLSRHLHKHLFFLVGGLFAYMLAFRLLGSRLLAVGAMLLFLLHPRIYAHSFFNNKDLPFLAMFMIALFLTHRAFKRDSLSSFALLGAGVGILMNLRIMGVLLLAAVPAMRALDFAPASGWAERKRVLLTTGAFALAGGLTIYTLLPYLWGDPVGRAVEWWATLSDHPYQLEELFRGSLIRSVDAREYLPVWFSITGAPFALLLGLIGTAVVVAGGIKKGKEFLRGQRRQSGFALLLAGAFIAPVLWVVVAGTNMYNGWRQMYFLWAPFALLAAFGLAWLVSALRRTRFRAAAYGAATAGLAATVVSMALIHPNQQIYFNLFADRVTPERLRWQYLLDYWSHSVRGGLEWHLRRSPQSSSVPSPITRSDEAWFLEETQALPESARERLANAPPFDIALSVPRQSWSRSARELHRVEVYGNTVWTFESLDDLREVYEAIRGREPVTDGAFDAYRVDGALALVMEPCAPAFVEDERLYVILRAFPVDPGDLPVWREGREFEPRRFYLRHHGAYFEGKCVASLPLPAYPLADFELRWSLELQDKTEAKERARRAQDEGRLLARAARRAAYDVYLTDGELAYLNNACDPPETEHPFHLNVYPERVDDLPEERRETSYERFHFEFLLNGALVDGGCAVFFPLPDYSVAAIQTGQRDAEGGDLWFAEFLLDPERRLADAASRASGTPIARGKFDVHLSDGALTYVKEPCEQADTDARFFLHITPERVSDLPEARRARGFDNLDFTFFPNGALFEGKCAARAALPEYPIASIRTGQHASGVGEIWSAEFAVGE